MSAGPAAGHPVPYPLDNCRPMCDTSGMTRTQAPVTAKRFAHLIDTATEQAQTLAIAADTLRALLPTLSPLGQETIRQQLERIERDERDMWDEVDFQICEAIQAGYGPEDMEN